MKIRLHKRIRYWWGNRRSALNTISLCHRLAIQPALLVDMGARNSEWAQYLVRRWPKLVVWSFDPSANAKPIGKHFVMACADRDGSLRFQECGKASHVSTQGHRVVMGIRFDSVRETFRTPAILKVDCENYSFEALRGCGNWLRQFELVHIEMTNRVTRSQHTNVQAEIWQMMLNSGFDYAETVDAAVWPRAIDYTDVAFVRKAK